MEEASMELEDIYRPPGADLGQQAPGQATLLPPFFQTSPLKVGLLSVATFGLYQLSWFYRHWKRRKEHGEDVTPFLRAIFAVWFMYSLCQSVNQELERRAGPGPSFGGMAHEALNAGGLAFGFFGLNMLWRISGPVSFLGILSFLPLVAVQRRINQLHAEMGLDPNEGSAFSPGTFFALVAGGLLWFLVGMAIFAPAA
jgi:hypothetical protein